METFGESVTVRTKELQKYQPLLPTKLRPDVMHFTKNWTFPTLLIIFLNIIQPPAHASLKQESPDDPSATVWLRRLCLEDIEAARQKKECKPFLPPETPLKGVQLCESNAPSTPCSCTENEIDARCKFKICGYHRGHYDDRKLTEFSMQVADELRSWGKKVLVSTRFTGFADGLAWGTGNEPQPQPVSDSIRRCLLKAKEENGKRLLELNILDRLDADLALLRGCSIEESVRDIMPNFQFDSPPTFSFDARKRGVEDPDIRAAELEVIIAGGCGRLKK